MSGVVSGENLVMSEEKDSYEKRNKPRHSLRWLLENGDEGRCLVSACR